MHFNETGQDVTLHCKDINQALCLNETHIYAPINETRIRWYRGEAGSNTLLRSGRKYYLNDTSQTLTIGNAGMQILFVSQ